MKKSMNKFEAKALSNATTIKGGKKTGPGQNGPSRRSKPSDYAIQTMG